MTLELDEAAKVGDQILQYYESVLPLVIPHDDGRADVALQLQWIPVRLARSLKAVLTLGKLGLHEEAASIVRVMVDHLITFAWILADQDPPGRLNAWKNETIRQLNARRRDAQRLGANLEEPPEPVDSHGVVLANTAAAAADCDSFWVPLLQPLFALGTPNSFAGLYAAIFRGTSPYVHPTLQGALGFFTAPKQPHPDHAYLINVSYADLLGTYSHAVTVSVIGTWILAARFRHYDIERVLPLVKQAVALSARHKFTSEAHT
jgi:hypothetical protein